MLYPILRCSSPYYVEQSQPVTGLRLHLQQSEHKHKWPINVWLIIINITRQLGRPEISRQQIQKLTPQLNLFPELFVSRYVGNSIKCKKNITPQTTPTFDMIKPGGEIKNQNKGIEDYIGYIFPLSLSTIGETTSDLTSKWRGNFQYFQKKM